MAGRQGKVKGSQMNRWLESLEAGKLESSKFKSKLFDRINGIFRIVVFAFSHFPDGSEKYQSRLCREVKALP
jgi:hypothetical protein